MTGGKGVWVWIISNLAALLGVIDGISSKKGRVWIFEGDIPEKG